MKDKSRNLQTLVKYFNRTTTSVSNKLSGVLLIILVLYSNYLLFTVIYIITTIIITTIIFNSRIN